MGNPNTHRKIITPCSLFVLYIHAIGKGLNIFHDALWFVGFVLTVGMRWMRGTKSVLINVLRRAPLM